MDQLVGMVTDALLPFLDRPLALFGHSMGASVAHEVAVRLERLHGHAVDTLFVSGRLPPRHQRPRDVHQDDETLLADVRSLDRDSAVLDDPDMRELMLPSIRADYRLTDTYRPSPSPVVSAPVVAYVGQDDPYVRVWQLSAWSEITEAGFETVGFPGDHFYLRAHEDELVQDIVRRLDARNVTR